LGRTHCIVIFKKKAQFILYFHKIKIFRAFVSASLQSNKSLKWCGIHTRVKSNINGLIVKWNK
ncbi:MAG: hypothetical protein ABFD07_07460, partial [Methanobacterium sp.]